MLIFIILFLFYQGNENNVLPEFCLCKNWKNGLFRCIKWHPHCNKFALVTVKDDVHIYSAGSSITTILKHRTQQNITCLAWRLLFFNINFNE